MPLGHTPGWAPATPRRHPSGSSSSRTRHSASYASSASAPTSAGPSAAGSTTVTRQRVPSSRHATTTSCTTPSRLARIVRRPSLTTPPFRGRGGPRESQVRDDRVDVAVRAGQEGRAPAPVARYRTPGRRGSRGDDRAVTPVHLAGAVALDVQLERRLGE